MKKLSLADKLAKKSFESPKFQQSWAVHMHSFGPILEPAFVDNYQAKVHLTAALNLISSRQLAQGFDKLKQMQKFCESDADKTAFLFFMGVCFEMMGDPDNMLDFYNAANEYGHSFYMPYMKVGKLLLSQHNYEGAYENYQSAVNCFRATGLSDQDKRILGSAYTSLASSLLMMHRYDEAEAALQSSRSLYPDAPGRSAVEAPLLALRKELDALDKCLCALREFDPETHDAVKLTTDGILAGTDPRFFAVDVSAENIASFWNWFEGYSPDMRSLLDAQEYEKAMTPVGEQLLHAFPFLEEVPYIAIGKNDRGFVLELHDYFAVGIADAYERLMEACPDSVKEAWQFFIVH